MKCKHCGGSVIYHPGNCLEQAALKCMACGRERREKMESKTKKCSECLEEKSLELFSMNKGRPDGHESRCKDCMKKKMQDYRDRKRTWGRGKGVGGEKNGERNPPRVRDRSGSETKVRAPAPPARAPVRRAGKSFPTITRSTPEQIIGDLRRGLAIEIIEMIQEKFGI